MSEVKVNKISPRTACGTVTLGDSGDTIALGSGASQTGFGRTGTVDWDTTPKTATFSAVSGDGFFANTEGGAFTMNLPAGVAGAIVSVADYAGTWQTNNLTVSPNGTDKIGGVNTDLVLNTEGQSVTFVFVDSTQGWINTMDSTSNERAAAFITATGGTITTSGNCKIHTFTGPGTFAVSQISTTSAENIVSYVVVAGGGGGGWDRAGGGGAGGFREVKSPLTPYTASPLDGYPSSPNRVTLTAASFPITVGGGGNGGANPNPVSGKGLSGSNSIFSTVTSAGGGGGGAAPGGAGPGVDGGSGGGSSGPGTGGSGNTPPVTPAQGTAGGSTPGVVHGSGGGGATVAGNPGVGPLNPGTTAGNGGAGATSSINGTPTARAGGGGGGFSSAGSGCSPFPGGQPGAGGGGAGGSYPGGQGAAATVNTGGGGGGGSNGPNTSPDGNGGNGGSGIVIIRYKYQ